MHYTKERAARLIASGETIENVAKIINKDPQTVRNYYLLPEFREYLVKNMAATCLATIVGYVTGEHTDKSKTAVAVTLFKMSQAKPKVEKRNGSVEDEETDLDEFSEKFYTEDQLRRLHGGG